MQYDMTPPRSGSAPGPGPGNGSGNGNGASLGDTASKTQPKWRIHFARPPRSATVASLAKPVTTATLVRNLELDEDAVRFSSCFLIKETHHLIVPLIETFYRGVST